MKLADRRVLVIGLGVSGRSAANFCARAGARVTAADEASADALGGRAELDAVFDAGIEVRVGKALPDPADFDIVVPSPGVPRAVYAARARQVWGDIELAYRALEVPIIAVTGTNGKSTTVLLIEAMLRAAGLRARAAGNLGTPALSLVGEPLDVAILEVSSFQLETVDAFRPRVSLILNLTPDHLDRHGDFAAYKAAKCNIFKNQEEDDTLVLNVDDPEVGNLAAQTRARVLSYSRSKPLERGLFLDCGHIVIRSETQLLRLCLDGSNLGGGHNLDNILASVACATALAVDPALAITALADFEGLPHRCETVATLDGVRYVNDSKATNPGAAAGSLASFDQPIIWLAGGRDKGLDFGELAQTASKRIKAAIFYGETAPQLETALAGRAAHRRAQNLTEAVTLAAQIAETGDVVLLAPACASFDQFESFEERGESFRAAVLAQANREATR